MNPSTHQLRKPNIVVFITDQLRSHSTPPEETQVPLPNIQRMVDEGLRLPNSLSICPLCTPARGMIMTGRYPQTTGVIVNFTTMRYGEIGLGDAFKNAGYRTGYVGKWHLNRGAFPSEARDFIPEGRARLGFDYWRAYNCHIDFWDGHVNGDDWQNKKWNGYETVGLMEYVREFINQADDRPWLLVVAPHQPHWNWADICAPEDCYARVPDSLELPPNVPSHYKEAAREAYRHYMAMTVAVDDMLGKIQECAGDDALTIFTSDHGTSMGAHAYVGEHGNSWGKSRPHDESIRVPLVVRWPGHIPAGSVSQELFTHVDLFPSLCGLAGIAVPRSVEGLDLSALFTNGKPPMTRDAALTMSFHNYVYSPNLILDDGHEWRGLRTKTHTYVHWRDGNIMMYDNVSDPWQMNNLAGKEEYAQLEQELEAELRRQLAMRGDDIHPYNYYRNWLDQDRRIVRNAWGPLSHPDSSPDWSLLAERPV